jgi:hypothetical protein
MSVDPSFASEIATAKILRQESIPSDVSNAPNFDQSEPHAKLRAVPLSQVRTDIISVQFAEETLTRYGDYLRFLEQCGDATIKFCATTRARSKM